MGPYGPQPYYGPHLPPMGPPPPMCQHRQFTGVYGAANPLPPPGQFCPMPIPQWATTDEFKRNNCSAFKSVLNYFLDQDLKYIVGKTDLS